MVQMFSCLVDSQINVQAECDRRLQQKKQLNGSLIKTRTPSRSQQQ